MADTKDTATEDANSELIAGRWYWVTINREDWFPAKHDPERAGGWTNEDTFEDFTGEVIGWRLIPAMAGAN